MPEAGHGDFYVGYRPRAPDGLAGFVRGRIVAGLILFAVLAVLLAASQRPFSKAVFEFGVERSFEGWLDATPYPTLRVDRPGGGASSYLLVAFGKHRADVPAGMDGRRVRLRGSLVYRDARTMVEVVDGSIEPIAGAEAAPTTAERSLGEHTLRGEIVDSKCFLGVMKPGNLKPHRACATRCISGGIPPVLLVRDREERAIYYLLTDSGGGAVNDRVLDLVAEPIEVTGEVRRRGDLLFLRADPATYRRLE